MCPLRALAGTGNLLPYLGSPRSLLERVHMSWLVILFAALGAGLILGALTFVSALIGGLVNAMIVLMCGPLIDRYLARKNRRSA